MIKRYCDLCGDLITDENGIPGRLKAEKRSKHHGIGVVTLNIEVITGKDGVSNSGDFCKYCVIKAVNELDDRSREVPA